MVHEMEAQIAFDEKDMKEEKASKAGSLEAKAEATGYLEATTEELATAEETLATARSTCMKVGADHEMTANARAEELKVIAEAKKILVETTSGAFKPCNGGEVRPPQKKRCICHRPSIN